MSKRNKKHENNTSDSEGMNMNSGIEESIEVLDEVEESPLSVIDSMKVKAKQELDAVLQELEKRSPGITEGMGTALGAGAGAVGSVTALSSLGISGLSAVGVTSGLSAAGGLIGGGMLVGIGVLATPVAALGFLGYTLAKKQAQANKAAAIGQAAKKICDIQASLMEHKESFTDELAYIKTTLATLTRMKTV